MKDLQHDQDAKQELIDALEHKELAFLELLAPAGQSDGVPINDPVTARLELIVSRDEVVGRYREREDALRGNPGRLLSYLLRNAHLDGNPVRFSILSGFVLFWDSPASLPANPRAAWETAVAKLRRLPRNVAPELKDDAISVPSGDHGVYELRLAESSCSVLLQNDGRTVSFADTVVRPYQEGRRLMNLRQDRDALPHLEEACQSVIRAGTNDVSVLLTYSLCAARV